MNILDMTPRKLMDFWKFTEEDMVVTGTSNGSYELDEISSYIWTKIDGQTTVEAIIKELVKLCEMEAQIDIVKNDVVKLMEDWKKNGLILLNYHSLCAFNEYDETKIEKIECAGIDLDVLLLVPPSPNPITGMNHTVQLLFPLGIAYLSSILKHNSYTAEPLNLWTSQIDEDSIIDLIKTANPKILGISSMTDNFLNGVRIADIAKRVKKDLLVVFGGPHITFTDEESLKKYTSIDIVVRGEGEYTLLDIADFFIKGNKTLKDIQGITYRSHGEIIKNKNRPLILDLDVLPYPDRSKTYLETSTVGIQTSRGCPGGCIFCVASSMSGGFCRMRSPENVVDEIEELYKGGARTFFFQDDTFTADIERLYKIFNMIDERGMKIIWNAESRVDVIDKDPDIFKNMRAYGCTTLQFGVEAGSQETLDNLKKNISIEQIFSAIKAAKASGIEVICSMLMGHPYDNKDTIMSSLEFAKKLVDLGAHTLFSIVCPYPGTQIEKKADFYGIKIHPVSYNDYFVSNAFIDTKNLTAKEIRNIYYNGMRDLVNYSKERKPEFFKSVFNEKIS